MGWNHSVLVVDGQKFQGELPVLLFLVDPSLHKLEIVVEAVVLLPDLGVAAGDVVYLLDVATLDPVRYVREVLFLRVEFLRLGEEPVALQWKQHVGGLAGIQQQRGQPIGDVDVNRHHVAFEYFSQEIGLFVYFGDGLQGHAW